MINYSILSNKESISKTLIQYNTLHEELHEYLVSFFTELKGNVPHISSKKIILSIDMMSIICKTVSSTYDERIVYWEIKIPYQFLNDPIGCAKYYKDNKLHIDEINENPYD